MPPTAEVFSTEPQPSVRGVQFHLPFFYRCISHWVVSPEAFSSSLTPVQFKLDLSGSVSFLMIPKQGQDHLSPQGS